MDFAESIPVLVAGELPSRVTHGVVGVAPLGEPIVDIIFISIDNSSFRNCSADQRGDRLLLHVWEHPDENLSGALHHAEDRRFLLLQRSSARSPSAGGGARPALFFDLLGMALMSCHYIDFVAFHLAAERDLWLPLNDTLTKLSG